MAQIPDYHPDLQLSGGNNTGAPPSPGEAIQQGLSGELQQVGQQVNQVSEKVLASEQDKKAQEDNALRSMLANQARQAAKMKALDLENLVYQDPNSNSQNLVKNFQDGFAKWNETALDNITDPRQKLAAQNEVDAVKNASLERLYTDSRKMYAQETQDNYQGMVQTSAALVQRNPLEFDNEMQKYHDTIANSQYTETNKIKAMQLGQKAMATAAVQGVLENDSNPERWNAAKNLTLNKFGALFNQKERDDLLNNINQKREQANRISLQEDDRSLKNQKAELDIIHEQYFRTRLNLANQFLDQQKPDPASIKEFKKLIADDAAQGDLLPKHFDFINKMLDNAGKEIQNDSKDEKMHLASDFASKITDADTKDALKKLKSDVVDASNRNDISPEKSMVLYNLIESEEKRQEARARAGKSRKNPLVSAAVQTIDKQFSHMGFLEGQNAKDAYNVKADFYKKLNSPQYKGNVTKALNAALSNNFNSGNPNETPGLPTVTPGTNKEIRRLENDQQLLDYGSKIKQDFSNGKITKDDYKGRLQLLNRKKQILETTKPGK